MRAASLTDEALSDSIARTESYLVERAYRGYDPYDALTSPVFGLPFLSRARTVQRMSQQILKRLPVNVRPLLGIRPGLNPVTLGLAIQAFAYLGAAEPERREVCRERAIGCLEELRALRAPGYSGACWGYDFGWQTRQGLFPAGTPTLVATGFVTNGLFTAYQLLGLAEALDLCHSACDFVVNDLRRTFASGDTLGWSYSPLDDTLVLNATGKAARLFAQVGSQTGDDELRSLARQSIGLVVENQRADGSWPYAVGDTRSWADNFHTGYVLECLRDYEALTGDDSVRPTANRGWIHYRRRFFTDDLIPRYFDNRTYPVDTTACAQSIFTLLAYGDAAAADRVAAWSIDNLQSSDGGFIYQIHPHFKNRIVYVRWSVAWMFSALARLLHVHRTTV